MPAWRPERKAEARSRIDDLTAEEVLALFARFPQAFRTPPLTEQPPCVDLPPHVLQMLGGLDKGECEVLEEVIREWPKVKPMLGDYDGAKKIGKLILWIIPILSGMATAGWAAASWIRDHVTMGIGR